RCCNATPLVGIIDIKSEIGEVNRADDELVALLSTRQHRNDSITRKGSRCSARGSRYLAEGLRYLAEEICVGYRLVRSV
ncbi:hypothetical protein U1Q18_021103, partial [Sarracenia purpurea var. burkii]